MPTELKYTYMNPGRSEVHWVCQQVTYGLRPEDIVVGLRLGYCEHAGRVFPRWGVPGESRFIAGTVTRIADGMMTIEYDGPPFKGAGVTCSISCAKFCILNDEPVKPKKVRKRRPPVKRPTRFDRDPVI
jgi:hypothetical protein